MTVMPSRRLAQLEARYATLRQELAGIGYLSQGSVYRRPSGQRSRQEIVQCDLRARPTPARTNSRTTPTASEVMTSRSEAARPRTHVHLRAARGT
jgi:hypothetical protein